MQLHSGKSPGYAWGTMISGISPYMPEPNHQAPSATAMIAIITNTV